MLNFSIISYLLEKYLQIYKLSQLNKMCLNPLFCWPSCSGWGWEAFPAPVPETKYLSPPGEDSLLWDLTGLCPTPSPAGVSQPSKWSPKIHQATRREENGLPVLSSPAGKSQCRLAPTRTQRQI